MAPTSFGLLIILVILTMAALGARQYQTKSRWALPRKHRKKQLLPLWETDRSVRCSAIPGKRLTSRPIVRTKSSPTSSRTPESKSTKRDERRLHASLTDDLQAVRFDGHK